MKESKEELINIGQEQIDKAVNLFECKAIDTLNFLTEQFKIDFASDIDNKLQGYKNGIDRLLLEYYELETENKEFCEHNKKLREENQQLKQRIDELETLQPKFKVGEEFYYIERGVVRSKKLSDYSVRTLFSGEIAIFYWLRYDEYVAEEDTFKTEEEALAELERRNKN